MADFEEFTRLYRESWEDPAIRWLLSNVSCAMVIDDHDVNDDWNISQAWVEKMAGGVVAASASAPASSRTGSTSSSATSRPS